ncbi:MAG: hypothetical protein JKY94_17325 [Rhodobacteraceae bacterium]|nr:hypothetical protein [Paracoccaceae bacterium]
MNDILSAFNSHNHDRNSWAAREVQTRYDAGNDAGEGFLAPTTPGPRMTIVVEFSEDDKSDLWASKDGSILWAVAGATEEGRWAVDVTEPRPTPTPED